MRKTNDTRNVGVTDALGEPRGLPIEVNLGEFTKRPHEIFTPPLVARLHSIAGNDARDTRTFPLLRGVPDLGLGRYEDNLTPKRKSHHFKFVTPVCNPVRATVGIDVPLVINLGCVAQETVMRGGERPEALRQPGLDEGATRSLQHIKISSFDFRIVLGLTRSTPVMDNGHAPKSSPKFG